jgi:hypothetical protein
MTKAKVIGLTVTALAVVGGIAVFNWVRKPKPNRDGFFSADGTLPAPSQSNRWCARRNPNRSVSYITNNFSDTCPRGWKAVSSFGDRTGV